jgi:hypothetical protein
MKVLILIYIICFDAHAGLGKLHQELQGMSFEKIQSIRKPTNKRIFTDKVQLKQSSRQRSKRLKEVRNNLRPYFANRKKFIKTLDQFYVVIGGNLKIMGGNFERIKVYTNSKKFPTGSYFSCNSYNSVIEYHYRIKFSCDKLITSDYEYPIKAHIKDLKKISGVTPDHVSTGEEEGIIKQFVIGVTARLLDTDKERKLTDGGYEDVPSDANALKDATLDGLKNVNSEISAKDSQKVVLAMNGKKKAIIEFLERFEFKRENI